MGRALGVLPVTSTQLSLELRHAPALATLNITLIPPPEAAPNAALPVLLAILTAV